MKEIHIVGAAIIDDGRCLVARRGPNMSLAGKWEFPGGKVEAGETPAHALRREIHEELGLDITVGARLGQGSAAVGTKRIVLDVYSATLEGGSVELREHSDARWFAQNELDSLDWAEADIPILDSVRNALASQPLGSS